MSNMPPPPGYQSYGSPAPAGPKPDNYLVWAILSTLFCCLPLGVASIVFAAQVDGKYNSGDYAGAVDLRTRQRSSLSGRPFRPSSSLR
jgi:hypothetical protein